MRPVCNPFATQLPDIKRNVEVRDGTCHARITYGMGPDGSHRDGAVRGFPDSKTVVRLWAYRGFESHPLRQEQSQGPRTQNLLVCGLLVLGSAKRSPRRGARVDDWARLESVCTFTGTVGSNPTPSATHPSAGRPLAPMLRRDYSSRVWPPGARTAPSRLASWRALRTAKSLWQLFISTCTSWAPSASRRTRGTHSSSSSSRYR